MALIDLKSNLANFRSDFSRESTKTSTVEPIPTTIIPKTSPVNPTGIPVKEKASFKDLPGQVNFFNDERGGAKGFVNKSSNRFNSNIIGINSGVYNYVNPTRIPVKDKTSLINPIEISVKDKISPINTISIPVKEKTSLINPIGIPVKDKTSPINPIEISIKDKISPINPITIPVKDKISPINPIEISIKDKASRINPITIPVKDKKSPKNIPVEASSIVVRKKTSPKNVPGQVNFFNDEKGGANGFTLKASDRFKSDFIGVNTRTFNSNLQNIKATPAKTSPKDVPGQVNFFNDEKGGAKGFSLKASDRFKSNFIGLEGGLYNYGVAGAKSILASNFITPPISIQHNDALPIFNPSILEIGTYKIDNQLGEFGSPFKYLKDGAISTKKFSIRGYHEKNKYNDVVKSVSNQSDKSLLYVRGTERNSLSAIDAEYVKYDLREESYNPTYMKQPFIVRDMGKRWGFRTSPGAFDDGLIRGGIVTALDRSIQDTVRIAKWMASPKGLLWVVKQIGLGLTNPNVEKSVTSTILGLPQTKVHTGLASLLSVPGAAFGLHFTRHGIPFLNQLASYENVIKINRVLEFTPESSNRLVKVRNELFGSVGPTTGPLGFFGKIQNVLRTLNGYTAAPILTLSAGIGGPGSVYGIGGTLIRRYTNTAAEALKHAKDTSNFTPIYNIKSQYGSSIATYAWKNTGATEDTNKNTSFNIDLQTGADGTDRSSLKHQAELLDESKYGADLGTPGGWIGQQIKINTAVGRRGADGGSAPAAPINNYITMAYHKIPKDSKKLELKGDFRNALEDDGTELAGGAPGIAAYTGKPESDTYFSDYNLEKRYGMGNPGAVGKDRSKPYTFLIPSSQFGTTNRAVLSGDTKFTGDKINALDIRKGTDGGDPYPANHKDFIKFFFEDGTQGENILVFRATMTGFTDSFSPGWDRIDIMGRPDGAYLYSTFERSISFNFIAAATSRSEMIPMWRKLNYLASYTMPDIRGNQKPSGPMMRFTIGDLFQRTPGFITSLSYTVPDDATWDIAEDKESSAPSKDDAKELPMVVEVSLSATIVGDYRPQQMGRVYSLSPGGSAGAGVGQWLGDAAVQSGS